MIRLIQKNNTHSLINRAAPCYLFIIAIIFFACKKTQLPVIPKFLFEKSTLVNGQRFSGPELNNISISPVIKISFTTPVNKKTVQGAVLYRNKEGVAVPYSVAFENKDSTLVFTLPTPLAYLTRYSITINSDSLKSSTGGSFIGDFNIRFITTIDSSRKFPAITDDELLTKVQQQTFKYFWDFGHPVSGLARERNTSGDVVTSGGSGFGVMAIVAGIHRNFITRAQGLQRLQTMVEFLKNKAERVKGAFPHWLNGATGKIVPFSSYDNGADIVETSYLMMGLLTARQYFDGQDAAESTLRTDITNLYNEVEWDWFRNGGQNVLYWHYSANHKWIMNLPIRGWQEALIAYLLAASSPTHPIPDTVYHKGWKGSNHYINGNTYYGYTLPLGGILGGPLFFSHYSFLGVNPNGLTEASIDYALQTKNHTLINYNYCKENPSKYFGYSDSVWGLTASDIEHGYSASAPTNDLSVIAPTAALSSMPYTPAESMAALKYFYYVLGDKIWKEYGFVDAFSIHTNWFASSFLAIDQGPIIIMIENHRSGLLWKLFTSCPEVKSGMKGLGFSAPYL